MHFKIKSGVSTLSLKKIGRGFLFLTNVHTPVTSVVYTVSIAR